MLSSNFSKRVWGVLIVLFFPVFLPAQEVRFSLENLEPVEQWIEARIQNAKKGKKEQVQVPLAVQLVGWGCPCPDSYVGTELFQNTSRKTWIKLTLASGVKLPPSKGRLILGEGFFTGKQKRLDLGNRTEPSFVYNLSEFRLLRYKEMPDEEEQRIEKGVLKVLKTLP